MPEIDVKTFRLIIKAGIPLLVLAFLGATWLWNRFRARLNPRDAAGEANARGQQLMQRGDLDAAEREYTNAIRLCPTEPNCLYNRAVLRIKQRRLDEAIDDLQQATELAPQDAQLHYKLGVTLRLAQRYIESMASCDESIRLQPENATFYLARGATFEELASEEAALRNYSRAAELDPDLLMARQQRARLYRQRRQFPEALEDLNYILGREPRREEVWNLRAIVKSEFGDHSGAIDDSSRAVELSPKSAIYLANRAHAFREAGRIRDALIGFSEALRIDPHLTHALNGRGWCQILIHNFPDALRDFDKTIEIEPENASAWTGRSNSLLKLGNLSEALAAGERATQIDPATGLCMRGLARIALGSFESGFRDLREHQRLNPHDPYAANRLAWVRSALDHPDARKPAEAVQYAELACSLTDFRNPAFVDTLASAYADAGRFEEAVRCQRKAVELLTALGNRTEDYESRCRLFQSQTPYRAPLSDLI